MVAADVAPTPAGLPEARLGLPVRRDVGVVFDLVLGQVEVGLFQRGVSGVSS